MSRFVDVMKLLALLSLSGKNSDEKCEAASLQKYFERFSSVVIVILLSQILGPLDIISKQLQSKSSDLSTATVLLQSLLRDLFALRNDGNNTVLCQGAGRELGHQERLFCSQKGDRFVFSRLTILKYKFISTSSLIYISKHPRHVRFLAPSPRTLVPQDLVPH